MAAPAALPPTRTGDESPTLDPETTKHLWDDPNRLWGWLVRIAEERGEMATVEELDHGNCLAQTLGKCRRLAERLGIEINFAPYEQYVLERSTPRPTTGEGVPVPVVFLVFLGTLAFAGLINKLRS